MSLIHTKCRSGLLHWKKLRKVLAKFSNRVDTVTINSMRLLELELRLCVAILPNKEWNSSLLDLCINTMVSHNVG